MHMRAIACAALLVLVATWRSPAVETRAATTPAFDHVFVIVMENHSYSEIIGSASAPYITSLLPGAAVATNYTGVTHPSLPNYLALTGGSTYGITSDCTTCWVSANNVADALEAAGSTWRAYEESMPSPCFVGDSYPYAQKHDPFIYFNDIRTNPARCQSHVVPYAQLATDLRSTSTTPNFAFITPNLCHDMHDCSVATGDAWLQQQVPAILGSPAFTTQRSILAITWDEDDSSSGNHVATLLLGPGAAPGARSWVAYNHYSLLRTIEVARGLGTVGPGDAGASAMNDLVGGGCAAAISLAASQATTEFAVHLTSSGCSAASFDVQQLDGTLSGSWYRLAAAPAYAGSAAVTADGFPGHSYEFIARVRSTSGSIGPWTAETPTTVASTATSAHPWHGMYTLDWYGGIHPVESSPLGVASHWSWPAAKSAKPLPVAGAPAAGLLLDAYGGVHAYGTAMTVQTTVYWPGWDIARDLAFLPGGTGGYVLDGYGGLHPFAIDGAALPPAPQGAAYFPGSDIARKVAIFPDGSGGYVLDGYGVVHAFGIGRPAPANPVVSVYWPGWDIARDFVLTPGGAGYVLDGYGGVHPFAPAGQPMPTPLAGTPYWSGWAIARGIWLLPGSATAGYEVDGWGGIHSFGGAPAAAISSYTPHSDTTRGIFGA